MALRARKEDPHVGFHLVLRDALDLAYFEQCLDRCTDDDIPREEMEPILAAATRVFGERHVADQDEESRWSGARQTAKQLLLRFRREGSDPFREQRRQVMSMMGVLGRFEDIKALIESIGSLHIADDERRLAFVMAARIIHREHRIGVRDEAHLDAIRDAVCAQIRDIVNTPHVRQISPSTDLFTASAEVLNVICLYRRNVLQSKGALLTEAQFSVLRPLASAEKYGPTILSLLAAARDPSVESVLSRLTAVDTSNGVLPWSLPPTGPITLRDVEHVRSWGVASRLLGDADRARDGAFPSALLATIRHRLQSVATSEACGMFEDGVGLAELELRGTRDPSPLDPDTMLGAQKQAETRPTSLEATRAASDSKVDAIKPFAGWVFTGKGVQLFGEALGASHTYASIKTDEPLPFLRLYRFDESAVELKFNWPEPLPDSKRLRLVLNHERGHRVVQPDKGKVDIEILFDGRAVDRSVVAVQRDDPVRPVIVLPDSWTERTEHSIIIRLHPNTTTTYRLYRAYLVIE